MRQATDKYILLKSHGIKDQKKNIKKKHEAIREQRRVVEMKGPVLS